jgi:hypothetical protein
MAINTPPKEEVIRSFKKRRTFTYLLWIIGGFFLAMMVSSLRFPDNSYTALPKNIEPWVLLAISLVALVTSWFIWHCPVCHKFLGISTAIYKCRKCNTVFQERR